MSVEYKGRSIEEQREINRKRRQEYREKKKLKDQGISVENISDTVINLDQIEESPKLSLKDKIFSKSIFKEEKEEKKTDKKRVGKTESLISNVLPLTLSSLIALNARKMIKEPYKDCAPSQEEVSSIMLPLFSYISRQIEITGKASQDAIDLGTALLSTLTVSMRMLMTHAQIKEEIKNGKEKTDEYEHTNITRDSENAASRYHRNITDQIISRDVNNSDGNDANIPSSGESEELRQREASLVRDLMRRDRQGRTRLGLAP